MVKLPTCGNCSIYPSLFCPLKDMSREQCAYAPLITEILTSIVAHMGKGTPIDLQEICARYIKELQE